MWNLIDFNALVPIASTVSFVGTVATFLTEKVEGSLEQRGATFFFEIHKMLPSVLLFSSVMIPIEDPLPVTQCTAQQIGRMPGTHFVRLSRDVVVDITLVSAIAFLWAW